VTEDELDQMFLQLAETGEYDKLLSQMRAKWSGIPRDEVRHFIQDACAEVVRRTKEGQTVTNLPGLIRTIADRALGKYWHELQDTNDAQRAMERLAAHGLLWRHDEEAVARVRRAADFVRALVPKLDNENWRRTIYAVLDAASEGRQAENKDLAAVLDAKPDTVGKWKERAIGRLAALLREEGYKSLDTLLLPPVIDDKGEEEPDEFDEDEEYDDE
jgi:hypothetical protein